jgi:putative DNA methylase
MPLPARGGTLAAIAKVRIITGGNRRMSARKKLIEVALPLEAINQESAREKSIRHGHPSTLHLWWARRPLASCRAVLFASLVDDPSSRPEEFPTEAAQEQERRRLMELIERLVKWENINDAALLAEAHAEIMKSTNNNPPPVLDPFCGGGSIPLEVQRLGLEAHASDINPVAVLITKALIEIPPRFKNMPPVNPEARVEAKLSSWSGAQGLAEDVRYYGQWVRDEAQKRIGHLYPKVALPPEQGGGEATVIAWLWARTVKCPNPACGCQMPLVKSFELSTKKGKETWVEPVIDRSGKVPTIKFEIRNGTGNPLKDGTVGRRGATCLACNTPTTLDHVRAEGKAQRMGSQLMAIVAEGQRGRIYFPANAEQDKAAQKAEPTWKPELSLPNNTRDFKTPNYGLTTFADLFTPRQLVALNTLSDLVQAEIQPIIKADAIAAGLADDDIPLREGGVGARAYAEAVMTYLGLGVSKLADSLSSLARWRTSMDQVISTFARQALPMVWDFAESNAFNNAAGDYSTTITSMAKVIKSLGMGIIGAVKQQDATNLTRGHEEPPLVFTTDPPYYDNISYAELADFFYVWLRRTLTEVYPRFFSTLATPKEQELIAAPYRFGGNKEKAKQFFESGLQKAFQQTYQSSHPDYPFSVFYAFKQTETEDSDSELKVTASTGWETMLEGLIRSGFSITGTWPMRTERGNRTVAKESNALASSIVLVCRPLSSTAPKATRRQFLNELQRELPNALATMQQGNIAPVDLAQASIGPGMAVFSRYREILEPNGNRMSVRTALQLINQTLDEYLSDQEGEFDTDTRWALTWYEQHQFAAGAYGEAETLSKAKVTSIQGLVNSGILAAKSGKVRLLQRDELPSHWSPADDERVPDWEATQHLIRALQTQGEAAAARLLAELNSQGDHARDLAYRLYSICDRHGWTQEAIAYNSLVMAWPELSRLASQIPGQSRQLALV